MNVAVKLPVELVVITDGTVVWTVPSNVIVILETAVKFCPVTAMTKLLVFFLPDCGVMVIEGFTVKVVWAEFLLGLSSVATMLWLPGADAGTVKDALNEPLADEVITAGEVAITVESNFMATIELAAKLEPDSETVVPGTPFVGFETRDGTITVNVADESPPESSAVTAWLAGVELGIANVAEKVPVPDEVTVGGVVGIFVVSNFIVIGAFDRKYEPVTVTVVPAGPLVGLSVIDRLPRVKVAVS